MKTRSITIVGGGVAGLSLGIALRRRDIPVVILSNSSRTDDRQRVIELGAASYLIKSNLSLRDLGAYVTSLLERS